jgi:hypothetical protein
VLCEAAEENHEETCQDSRCSDRDVDWKPRDYKCDALPAFQTVRCNIYTQRWRKLPTANVLVHRYAETR